MPYLFTVEHLSRYLAMRLTLDIDAEIPATELQNFSIYIASQPTQFIILNGNQTLQQVNEKFWKVSNISNELNCYRIVCCLFIQLEFSFQNRSTSQWKCTTRGKNPNRIIAHEKTLILILNSRLNFTVIYDFPTIQN